MSIFFNSEGNNHIMDKNFMKFYKAKWNELHDKSTIFRYKINNVVEKVIHKKYLMQLNLERTHKRRAPQHIDNMCQPFDEKNFNFTKISLEEIMCRFNNKVAEDDSHAMIVNVSPIVKYHALLCPSIDKCLPQVVTKDSLQLAIDIMFLASDRDLRIGFNSLCAMASVNHLHYHMCLVERNLPVESLKCKQIKGPLYCFAEKYPAHGFCFEIGSLLNASVEIYKLLEYLLKQSIAHNILITRGASFTSDKEIIRVIVYPRKSSSGVKQFDAFNVAVFELSGWLIVSDKFDSLEEKDIENELHKWRIDNFDELCDEVKTLY